jgi:hypothetical protein
VLLTATPGRLLTLLSRRPVLLKPKMRPTDDGTDTRGLSVALVLEEVCAAVHAHCSAGVPVPLYTHG